MRWWLISVSAAVCFFACTVLSSAKNSGWNEGADGDYGDDSFSSLEAVPDKAISKYGRSLPPDKQESYNKLKTAMFRKSFIDLYLIRSDPGGDLCDKIECYENSPSTVKFVADAIIQGRKDEEIENTSRSSTRSTTIASLSAMLSAVLSLATLLTTLRKTGERK